MLIRRWVQASAITGIERTIRGDLYAHVQRLHAGFHDAWQSGQLLSRATTDLSAIRRFAGFGLIFFITSLATFAAVVILLIRLNWWLGLLTGCVFAPVVAVCARFERRYKVLSRRAQDQQGDLATYVEEAAGGIRVLKALGRSGEAAGRHTAGATEMYRTQVEKARLLGGFYALLDLIPNAALCFLLLLGAVRDQPPRADPGRPGRVHHPGPAAGLADRGHGVRPGVSARRRQRQPSAMYRAVRHGARDH